MTDNNGEAAFSLEGTHYKTNERISVQVLGGRIANIQTVSAQDRLDLPIIGPGLVDLQLNGAFGLDFNAPMADGLMREVSGGLWAEGVTTFLPTIFTNSDEAIEQLMADVAKACAGDGIVNSAVAWVGQHAKAGTEYAQMAHTGWFNVIDYKINGVSVGEFGTLAMCGAFLGVRSIFGSGDEAFAREAAALIGGIETVSVKRGITPGSGDEHNTEGYKARNDGAIHMHPNKARKLIRSAAESALHRFIENREQFSLLELAPPFRREVKYRSNGKKAPYTQVTEHPDNLIHLLRGMGNG